MPTAAEGKPPSSDAARTIKPLIMPKASDDDLLAAWGRWKRSSLEQNAKPAEEAQRDLIALKDELGIADLDAFSIGFIRAAEARMKSSDAMGAVGLSTAAVELAPDLPHAHLGLARAYAFADPADAPRYISEFAQAVRCLWVDPRYRQPVIADVAVSLLLALFATTLAVIAVLFLRVARLLLHDVHHLFPHAAMRWQSAVFAFVLLSLPIVLRLGVMPAVLIFFAAAVLYLSTGERAVASILIALLALAPPAARWIASASTFPGTLAEEVYQLERGGLEAGASAGLVRRRASEKKAGFEELFALARYELRRGQLDSSIAHFELAAAKRSNEPRLLTNLGNAMFAKGDVEGAAEAYTTAGSLDPSSVAPFYNLSILSSRRAAALPPDAAVAEIQKAQNAADVVQRLEPALLVSKDARQQTLLNRALLSPGLTSAEILQLLDGSDRDAKVESQLSLQLLGNVDPSVAWLYPMAIAFALTGFAALLRQAKAAKACLRCGRPVCRRCDPELSVGSALCQQCVNVFARKNVVVAPVKIRKQIEIAQFRAHTERLTYAFGFLCSGAGHVFSGLPVRGAIYAFLFLFALVNILFRHGVVRYPYGAEPLFVRLAPLAVLLMAVYLLSLRGLYKQQS
jgi:tetratricopeptide (TPR) repeat protein